MGVGVAVAVDVGTGVRVGVIVGGGVGVGVLVFTMSYEPAAGRDGVGILVGVIVACGVAVPVGTSQVRRAGRWAVAWGVAVLVNPGAGGGDPGRGVSVGVAVGGAGGGDPGRGVSVGVAVGGGGDPGSGVGVRVGVAVGGDPGSGVGVRVGVAVGGSGVSGVRRGVSVGVAVGGPGVCVGVTVAVTVGVAVGGPGVCVGVAVGVAVTVAVDVGVGVTVGVAVTVGVGVGVGVNGTCATSSVAGQVLPPVPPTALVMTRLVMPCAVSVDVRSNDVVSKDTLMTYGDSAGAPSRTQISLPRGAVQTTAIGSGGTWRVSCIPSLVTVVCVEETLLQVNAVEAMDVVRVNSLAAGTPVPDARLSNPARAGVLVAGAGNAIVAVIVPPVAAVADIERNWSLFIVVVEVTYSVGMV